MHASRKQHSWVSNISASMHLSMLPHHPFSLRSTAISPRLLRSPAFVFIAQSSCSSDPTHEPLHPMKLSLHASEGAHPECFVALPLCLFLDPAAAATPAELCFQPLQLTAHPAATQAKLLL